jgi:hypothetical protein
VTSGLLDTSVLIDWYDPLVVAALPDEMAISTITAAAHANRLSLYTRNVMTSPDLTNSSTSSQSDRQITVSSGFTLRR